MIRKAESKDMPRINFIGEKNICISEMLHKTK